MSRIRLGRHHDTRVPFSRPVESLRTATYVAGSPGMGKSTLLGNLCEQFSAAGDGVLLLDIKGDLARDIASRTLHPEQVIYVQPGVIHTSSGDRVWTLNPFDGHRDRTDAIGQIATNVLDSFDRMGRTDLAIMANIRQSLAHAIRLALTTPDPTLLDLLLIVVDQSYRQELMRSARHLNHITRRFWTDLDDPKFPARERRGQLNTTRNRLEALLMDRELNLFVGRYRSTLKLQEWLNQGKMILVDLGLPLPRGLGIDIGNVIMSQMITETFLRSDADKRVTWRLVVDEFHEFVGDNFATIITDARSYNVFPVIAHQDRSQLERLSSRTLKSAVGHAGVKCLLASSPEDRVAFASLYGRDQADLVLGLDRFKAVVSVMDGLAGTRQTETLVLDDWWGPPRPGQLDELQRLAESLTVSKREVVTHNNRRYWDRLDALGVVDRTGGTRERAAQPTPAKPPRREKAPGPRPPQPRPDQAPPTRDDSPRPADADGPRSASLLDGPPDL